MGAGGKETALPGEGEASGAAGGAVLGWRVVGQITRWLAAGGARLLVGTVLIALAEPVAPAEMRFCALSGARRDDCRKHLLFRDLEQFSTGHRSRRMAELDPHLNILSEFESLG